MNRNYAIAIKWVLEEAKKGIPIYSDQLFAPFNEKQSKRLRRKLVKAGMLLWPMSPPMGTTKILGAILISKDAPNLRVLQKDGHTVATQMVIGDNVRMLLGSSQFKDLVGVM